MTTTTNNVNDSLARRFQNWLARVMLPSVASQLAELSLIKSRTPLPSWRTIDGNLCDFEGVDVEAVKSELVRRGYLFKRGHFYRVRAKFKSTYFAERIIADPARVEIEVLSDGYNVLLGLYIEQLQARAKPQADARKAKPSR